MRIRRSDSAALAGGLLAVFLTACGLGAQTRDVLSKRVSVGQDEAALHLELEGGGELDVAFEDGVVSVDGDPVGEFEPGGPLDVAWRTLLGQAVALDDGPLGQALIDWSPPEGLAGAAAETARRIDETLEAALAPEAAGAPGVRVRDPVGLRELLGRGERLAALARAVDGLRFEDADVRIGSDVEIERGERVSGALIVIDGDLDVRGEVEGPVIVAGGTLRTYQGSRIDGEVRLADARIVRNGGAITGEVVGVEESGALPPSTFDPDEMRERIEAEVRRELRAELRDEDRNDRRVRVVERDRGPGLFAPLRYVGSAVGGVIETAFSIVVLSVFGGALLYLGRDRLDTVAETARRSPGRAATVGLAGAFLVLPVYVLGMLALVVSIIGIPVVLVWAPLFPLAVLLAAGMGYFAVARNVGSWVADQDYPYTGWIRRSNPYTLVVGGVIALMAAFLFADVLRLGGPFLGFLRGLLATVGVLATVAALLVGFGAFLITRGGRRPEYYGGGDYFPDGGDADLWDAAFEDVTPTGTATGPAGTGASGAPADPAGGAKGGTKPRGDATDAPAAGHSDPGPEAADADADDEAGERGDGEAT